MQELAVGIIVVLAGLYIGAKYLPAAWRRALVLRLSKDGDAGTWVARWLDATGAGCGSGGGSCSSCGSATPCETDEQAPQAPAAPGKHRVIKLHERR